MRLRFTAFCIALIGILVGTLPAAAAPGTYQAPRKYYLALGDSLAYGFEASRFVPGATADSFDTGYVNDFWNSIKTIRPDVQLVNFGCPGETTQTYLAGCSTFPIPLLHNPYTTSQQAAAVAFLGAHPGQVSPITVDLGANDAIPLLHTCPNQACIAAGLIGIGNRLGAELATLRTAAPRAEIIVMQYYNPLYVVAPSTDVLVNQLNAVIAAAAAPAGARLADAFPVINGNPSFPNEFAAVASLTGMVSPPPGGDIHANDTGYGLIAGQFWLASGYGGLD
jgi:lysophospholipase L1-like esterase